MIDLWRKIEIGKGKKYREGFIFLERKGEQLTNKKLSISSIFIIIDTKFANFCNDIYDASLSENMANLRGVLNVMINTCRNIYIGMSGVAVRGRWD